MLTWHEGSTLLSNAAIARLLFSCWAFEWCHCGLILLARRGDRLVSGGWWALSDRSCRGEDGGAHGVTLGSFVANHHFLSRSLGLGWIYHVKYHTPLRRYGTPLQRDSQALKL